MKVGNLASTRAAVVDPLEKTVLVHKFNAATACARVMEWIF